MTMIIWEIKYFVPKWAQHINVLILLTPNQKQIEYILDETNRMVRYELLGLSFSD